MMFRSQWMIYIATLISLILILIGATLFSNEASTISSSSSLSASEKGEVSLNEVAQAKAKTNKIKRQLSSQRSIVSDSLVAGFIAEGNYILAVATCTSCHSSELVTQNRATKEGWQEIIWWMQKTQNLWDLGDDEEKILAYLSTYYAPKEIGRRANLILEESDWYRIK